MAVIPFKPILERLKLSLRNETCSVCQVTPRQKLGQMICPACEVRLLLRQPVPVTTIPAGALYAACGFPYPLKKMLYNLKFQHQTQHGITLAEILIHYWQHFSQNAKERYLILPVPPHTPEAKTQWTGHLPYIIRPFASHFGYDFIEQGLQWTRAIPAQHTLFHKRKRRENIAGALQLSTAVSHRIRPETRILIVDDILTTGSTLSEAMTTVQQAHPQAVVSALAVAHVPLAITRQRPDDN